MSEAIKDLKIIYRPFGFTEWAKHFDNVYTDKEFNNISKKALILIGTGNVGKFHIKFNKRIRIAKKNLKVSYFKFNEQYKSIWKELSSEKLIFREIAKDLTCVYDPGIFANVTGLYFVRIPSFNTNKLFCLLTIMNSDILNTVFKTLFSTLHMSGGYLRFNGSFIKRLPMPHHFPVSISYLGKMIQFVSQLHYEIFNNSELKLFKEVTFEEIEKYLEFFKILANSLTYLLYLQKIYKKLNINYTLLEKLLHSENYFPNIQFKFIQPRFNLPKFEIIKIKELESNLLKVKNIFFKFNSNYKLINEIKDILRRKIFFKN